MEEQARTLRIEPRWPVALAILVVLFILALLPARVRLFPAWLPYLIGITPLVPLAGVRLSGADARWLRAETAIMLIFSGIVELINIIALAYLISRMLNRPEILSGKQLLTSSIGAWVANVLAFSLVYWQIDRGGPEARANGREPKPDWLFPRTGAPEVSPAGWRPIFVDYLFLSFSTATAFSATDTLPLTGRAKMLMMLESTIALVTLVIVASRAINIIGS